MIKVLLYPLSWLYGMVIWFRNRAFDLNILKSTEFELPVISLGNITVGGTGKTPHVEYLVDLLSRKFIVATLSRGYKRKTNGFYYVEQNATVAEVGDEPLQIKSKFPEVTVSVCENRVKGVEKLLLAENGKIPNVILLDDAFQHRKIIPGLNILLIDYNRQIKEDKLLPLGRLREGVSQMRRANIIIFTKCPKEVTPIMRRVLQLDVGLRPYQKLYFTVLDYQKLEPVFSAKKLGEDFYNDKTYSAIVVTGVASPKLIHRYLEKLTERIEPVIFRDHHNFSKEDIVLIMKKYDELFSGKKIIITTEKDAIRLREMEDLPEKFKNVLYSLPVKVQFLEGDGKSFDNNILNYVEENKSNFELHKRKGKVNA
jgi:tetraacyldisaccharide 4'-kinase